jgi:RNA polymerase sigma-70 factor (ECF subfamily)
MTDAEAEVAQARDTGSEEQLVQGLREGDPGAYAQLYNRFTQRVHRFVHWRLSGDSQTAEEITVHTLAEAVRCVRSYDARRSSFLSWLLGIASRQTLAELRRRQRRKSVPAAVQVPLGSVAEEALASDPTSRLTEQIEAQRQVGRLRAHLSQLEMEVLVLQGAYELTAREIGQVLGKSERAISSLLHRARAKARERLVNDGQDH